jgi:hypothetical protein
MAKTKGPAFSLTASGTIGNALTYQKNKAGKYVRGYNKPSGPPSINQEVIRQYTKEAVALWHWLTDDERELWNRYVQGKTIEDNLAALWPMNEGSGWLLPEHSRYRIEGWISWGTWVDGKFGKALYFDGTAQWVDCPNPESANFGTSDYTLEVWVKTPGAPGAQAFILSKNGPNKGFVIWLPDDGLVRFYIMDAAFPRVYIESIATIDDNEWHHLVFTADRDADGIIYIDGDEDNRGDISSKQGSISTTQPVYIASPNNHFEGTIDEVAFYNRVLTPTEVKQRAERKDPGVTFPTGTISDKLPSPEAYSGYHCFISQFTKNRMQGKIPWRLPTGVYF